MFLCFIQTSLVLLRLFYVQLSTFFPIDGEGEGDGATGKKKKKKKKKKGRRYQAQKYRL